MLFAKFVPIVLFIVYKFFLFLILVLFTVKLASFIVWNLFTRVKMLILLTLFTNCDKPLLSVLLVIL